MIDDPWCYCQHGNFDPFGGLCLICNYEIANAQAEAKRIREEKVRALLDSNPTIEELRKHATEIATVHGADWWKRCV